MPIRSGCPQGVKIQNIVIINRHLTSSINEIRLFSTQPTLHQYITDGENKNPYWRIKEWPRRRTTVGEVARALCFWELPKWWMVVTEEMHELFTFEESVFSILKRADAARKKKFIRVWIGAVWGDQQLRCRSTLVHDNTLHHAAKWGKTGLWM